MNPKVKKVLAVIAGVVTAGVVISLVEWLGHTVYPLPEGLDPLNDRDGFEAYLASVPVGAKAFVVMAWTLGTLIGGVVARLITPVSTGWVSGFVILGIAINAVSFPGQWPMAVIGVALVTIAAWLAARLTTPKPPAATPAM